MNEVYLQLWLLTSDIWSEVHLTGFYHDQPVGRESVRRVVERVKLCPGSWQLTIKSDTISLRLHTPNSPVSLHLSKSSPQPL